MERRVKFWVINNIFLELIKTCQKIIFFITLFIKKDPDQSGSFFILILLIEVWYESDIFRKLNRVKIIYLSVLIGKIYLVFTEIAYYPAFIGV